ncbi:MAG: hypothetical protein DME15_15415 [Candidatus Rokuibacteriota bacterium]|nr:MAG: hypothetical protein DME15_15415 [Candidatus Rokubacteria bacterium]
MPFPDDAVAELEALVRALRKDPLPLLLLSPSHFALTACADMMAVVRRKLRNGVGLAVIDRVPVERFSADENRALYWLLGGLLGRLVAQKWDGTMSYDVRDTGKALEYGVRRSVTSLELQFHTDAPWLTLPPELVGLLCLSPAREGGVSRFLSLVTVHNELRPVFQSDGRDVLARYNEALILNGEALTGVSLDPEGRQALAAMRAIVESPESAVELTIEKGQIQYLNNHHFAHSRTAFKDAEEPHLKRHLIRLWNRDAGRQTFHGR